MSTNDDATIVHDPAAEEQADAELVGKVTKILEQPGDAAESTEGQMAESHSTEGQVTEGQLTEDRVPEESAPKKGEEPSEDEMSDELQARAEQAGISKELAEHLHQSGVLEETLAAFDRTLIERFQAESTEAQPQKPPKGESQVAEGHSTEGRVAESQLELDEAAYDEDLWDADARKDLLKRDAYHKQRIDALEAQVAGLLQAQQSAFDKRFDGMIDGLGHKDLFGEGDSIPKDKQANRDTLFRAYCAVCQAYDVDPNDCDPQWAKRALAAMFPKEVFKQVQRQTVKRLRDAQGKFLSPSKPKGAPPDKEMTEEEAHDHLVSNVTSYLKEHGVQMSGV